MAVRTTEEIMASIKSRFGEDTSDDTIALVEDISDTLNSLTNANNGEDWKKKYEDNDSAWRKKYRDRFFSGSDDGDEDDPRPEPKKKYTFESLFKEG